MAKSVAAATELTQTKAAEVVNIVLATIQQTLANGESVVFPGFGSFEVHETAPRSGRNPRTGETLDIPAGKRVVFRAGSTLKSAVK